MNTMAGLEGSCIERGIKLTAKRRAVLKAMAASGVHADVEQIYRCAGSLSPKISRGTVYRTLNILEEAGIIARHAFTERRVRYNDASTRHYHLIDTDSGRVTEFESTEIEKLIHRVAENMGFRLTALSLKVYGVIDEADEHEHAVEE